MNLFPITVSLDTLIMMIVVTILNAGALSLISFKLVHMLQGGGYRTNPYIDAAYDKRIRYFNRLFSLGLLAIGAMIIVNTIFYQFTDIPALSYLGFLFYAYLVTMFLIKLFRERIKIPLRFTPRVIRLYITIFILCALFTFYFIMLGLALPWYGHIGFSLIAIIPILLPSIVLLANYIMWPIEASIRQHYIRRAKRKLNSAEYRDVIRVGITGSYGKTSCKNILVKMLAQKYNVAASPSSYNTPMGFALTINNVLQPGHEILVFEMGLRYRRDIKQLCKLFQPQHGILTAVGSQHIETMGSLEAIKAEKSELVRALPEKGIAILNGDSTRCAEVFSETTLKNKYLTTLETHAANIAVTSDGATFDLIIDGETVSVKTQLLGEHSIQNIAMCAEMAYRLGITREQIATAISELEPIPHRLQLIKSSNGVTILDDSYNASEHGTRAALAVLELFDGKRVVQTPGIIEQGTNADEVNFKLGYHIAKVADACIIMNRTNREALRDGLRAGGMDPAKIETADNIDMAKTLYPKILAPGDTLLIANDLPDNFS
ncbi:MAG: Mur ligase family protein [Firmicutes bacterium]|nr:Mur ligase family protein [Bacillota bacterium]